MINLLCTNVLCTNELFEHGVEIIKHHPTDVREAAKRISNLLSTYDRDDRLFLVAQMKNNKDVRGLKLEKEYFDTIFDKVTEQ